MNERRSAECAQPREDTKRTPPPAILTCHSDFFLVNINARAKMREVSDVIPSVMQQIGKATVDHLGEQYVPISTLQAFSESAIAPVVTKSAGESIADQRGRIRLRMTRETHEWLIKYWKRVMTTRRSISTRTFQEDVRKATSTWNALLKMPFNEVGVFYRNERLAILKAMKNHSRRMTNAVSAAQVKQSFERWKVAMAQATPPAMKMPQGQVKRRNAKLQRLVNLVTKITQAVAVAFAAHAARLEAERALEVKWNAEIDPPPLTLESLRRLMKRVAKNAPTEALRIEIKNKVTSTPSPPPAPKVYGIDPRYETDVVDPQAYRIVQQVFDREDKAMRKIVSLSVANSASATMSHLEPAPTVNVGVSHGPSHFEFSEILAAAAPPKPPNPPKPPRRNARAR